MLKKGNYLLRLEKKSRKYLNLYNVPERGFGTFMISSLLLNIKNKFTLKYKEIMLSSGENEMLTKYYTEGEAKLKLRNILDLYQKYTAIFPNYICIDIHNLMLSNITEKQKRINMNYEDFLDEESETRTNILDTLNEELNTKPESVKEVNRSLHRARTVRNREENKSSEKNVAEDVELNDSISDIEGLVNRIVGYEEAKKDEIRKKRESEKKEDDLFFKKVKGIAKQKLSKFHSKNISKDWRKSEKFFSESNYFDNTVTVSIKDTKFKSVREFVYEKKEEEKASKIDFLKEESTMINEIFKNIYLLNLIPEEKMFKFKINRKNIKDTYTKHQKHLKMTSLSLPRIPLKRKVINEFKKKYIIKK